VVKLRVEKTCFLTDPNGSDDQVPILVFSQLIPLLNFLEELLSCQAKKAILPELEDSSMCFTRFVQMYRERKVTLSNATI